MERLEGIHFYIDVKNLNEVVADEEERTGGVKHAVHALDTLFTSIERYGKRGHRNLVVEKITGSRLHLYVVDGLVPAFDAAADVIAYAYQACGYLNAQIYKYRLLKDLVIRAGAAYGEFYDFTFTSGDYTELTTIGYVANISAKLQTLSGASSLSVTEGVYSSLGETLRGSFSRIEDDSLEKYGQDCYYSARLADLCRSLGPRDLNEKEVRDYANSLNLEDLRFDEVRRKMSFDDITRTHGKRIEGVPLFADVRDFTSKFDEDDINLDEMSERTRRILEALYSVTTGHGGLHVQFQGDREFALFHNVPMRTDAGVRHPEERCFKAAVLAAMRMIDAVRGMGVHIGVGGAFGTMYAAKIGTRGEKDRILLGETVIEADLMEDRHAKEDEIAITGAAYEGLCAEDPDLAEQFTYRGGHYVTHVGFDEYRRKVESRSLYVNTRSNNYNGAWGTRP